MTTSLRIQSEMTALKFGRSANRFLMPVYHLNLSSVKFSGDLLTLKTRILMLVNLEWICMFLWCELFVTTAKQADLFLVDQHQNKCLLCLYWKRGGKKQVSQITGLEPGSLYPWSQPVTTNVGQTFLLHR